MLSLWYPSTHPNMTALEGMVDNRAKGGAGRKVPKEAILKNMFSYASHEIERATVGRIQYSHLISWLLPSRGEDRVLPFENNDEE